MSEVWEGVVLVLAALVAGGLNSVAGGGTFFTFPAMVWAGLPPISANATSAVVQWPGYVAGTAAFRRELWTARRGLAAMSLAALAGGLVGALLLLVIPARAFDQAVPFLILLATLLFAGGSRMVKLQGSGDGRPSVRLLAGQFCVTAYGGFFGGGLGIMLLALYAFAGMHDMNRMNGLKSWASALVSAISVVAFVSAGIIDWYSALLMIPSCIAGSWLGARWSRRLPVVWLKRMVVAIGLLLSAVFFVRAWG